MFAVLLALLPILQPPLPSGHPPIAPRAYVPERVYDTERRAFTDFESMLAALVRADLVFVGEQHDDANTHALEVAVIEGMLRRHASVTVAMEMFERDVQPALDEYLRGAVSETQFLAASRPWPRYATDYRPIVELARVHKLPVIASNAPRRIAMEVATNGLTALESLGADRALVARDLQCDTRGDYYRRFIEQMGGHPPSGDPAASGTQAKNDRFYVAQCVKDETMAETVAETLAPGRPRTTIVHFNGAFHSDYGEGAAERARRRLPDRRVAVISIIPVDDLDALAPDDDDLKQAAYLVFTVKN